MKHLAVGRENDGAGAVNGLANVVARDLSGARVQIQPATTVQSTHQRPTDGEHRFFDGCTGNLLGVFNRSMNGGGGFFQIDDGALARAPRLGQAVSAITQRSISYIADEGQRLGTANIDDADQTLAIGSHEFNDVCHWLALAPRSPD